MFNNRFGIEIEFTGITREYAAEVAVEVLGGRITRGGNCSVIAPDGREWQFVYDGSVTPLKKVRGSIISANDDYKVELVSPILTYREDINTLQELVRRLRKAGAFTKGSVCGCHIHLDGTPHTPTSVRNFINIIASKNDLFYKALQIEPERMRYCKKIDSYLVERMNNRRPNTFNKIESIWYEGYSQSNSYYYHQSRYELITTGSHIGFPKLCFHDIQH